MKNAYTENLVFDTFHIYLENFMHQALNQPLSNLLLVGAYLSIHSGPGTTHRIILETVLFSVIFINLLSINMFMMAPKSWTFQWAFGSVLGMLQSVISNLQQLFR